MPLNKESQSVKFTKKKKKQIYLGYVVMKELEKNNNKET